jgi:ribosomal protein S18 acetylase RimI-like enzyme
LLTVDDVDFALAQTSREGWDTTSGVFDTLLAHDPDGCFLAEQRGEPVGMVTTTVFEKSAWIGNVIVPPEHRRRGIGEELTRHALTDLCIRTVRLEADPPGVGIYRRLGFKDEFESLRFRHEGLERGTQTERVVCRQQNCRRWPRLTRSTSAMTDTDYWICCTNVPAPRTWCAVAAASARTPCYCSLRRVLA